MEWKCVQIVFDGQALDLDGVNPWDYDWEQLEEQSIEVPHPDYPKQRHMMWLYRIEDSKIKLH